MEQRGLVDEAEYLMRRGLAAATDPGGIAFCRHQSGDLAWNRGDLVTAEREYLAGVAAAPDYLPLTHGLARLAAARGDHARALAAYAGLTRRSPTPQYLIEYGELLRSLGRLDEAGGALALADAALTLLASSGGGDDLAAAQLATVQLRYGDAVRLAQREWKRRQHPDVADALAWALHLAGRDAEALPYARRALHSGARNASYSFHLGLIELALGDRTAARRDLARSVAINPFFSPMDAPLAWRALAAFGGTP